MLEYKLLTLRQVAELLQIRETEVGQFLRNGYLPGYKLGREWRISLDGLNSFIQKYGNMSPDQLRSGNSVSGLNGTQGELDGPRPRKVARSTEATKKNNDTSDTESNWVPPWREGE